MRGVGGLVLTGDQGSRSTDPGDDLAVKTAEIASFLASDDEPFDDESEDDADIFVGINTAGFLSALGLSIPDDLADPSA